MPAPVVAGALSLAIGWVLGALVRRVILGLGIGVAVYVGASELIDAVNGYISANMGALPATVFQMLNVLNVPTAFNLILSAITFHYTLIWTSKKIVFNPPS